MDTWAYDDLPVDPREDVITNYLNETTDDFNLAKNAGRMWGLYLYLTTHIFQSPADVHASIFMDSRRTKPMFTETQATSIFELLNTQKGGAAETPEVLDNMIMKWVYFIRGWTPAFITDTTDTFAPYVFILKGLEENEEYGVLLGIALDATEAGLKSTAAVIQNMAPVIIGLLPIPEAGPVGAVIGWMVASVFIFLLLAIHVSRRQFGQAFIVSFGLIPIVGESIYNAAMSSEKFLQKTSEKRARLIKNVRKMLGDSIADTLDAVVPNPLGPVDGNPTLPEQPMQIPTSPPVKQQTPEAQAQINQYLSQLGGKGFSRKQAKTSKWRTQRRKFAK